MGGRLYTDGFSVDYQVRVIPNPFTEYIEIGFCTLKSFTDQKSSQNDFCQLSLEGIAKLLPCPSLNRTACAVMPVMALSKAHVVRKIRDLLQQGRRNTHWSETLTGPIVK